MKKTETVNGWSDYPLKKTFLIMRIIVFLLLATIIQTYANDAYSQRTKLSLNFNNTALEQVLDAIENQSEFFFLYNEKLVDVHRKVSVKANDQAINEILQGLFEGTDVEYSIIDRKIVLAPENIDEIIQQQQIVKGTVTDLTGAPLPGVTVVIKGTTQGAVTDANGNYQLSNLPNNATLVFSFVGMKEQEVLVEGQSTINIRLKEETIGIEEIVAIGYGTQKKMSVTGAISSVQEEDLQNPVDGNVLSRLQGRVAGVTILNDNSPGGSPNIRIRGVGSINNNDPLFVIDGVPTSGGLEHINPKDIINMTVLKDASSSAIYGSRAANGVVIIETNRGAQGRNISFSLRTGIQRSLNELNLLNTKEFGELLWLEFKNDGLSVGDPGWGDLQYGYGANPVIPDYILPTAGKDGEVDEALYSYPSPYYAITKANKEGTNWYDQIFTIAPFQEYNLSMSGRNDKSNFNVSTGYLNQQGIIVHTEFSRYNLRTNADVKLNDWLEISESLGASYTERYGDRTNNSEYSAVSMSHRAPPIVPIYDIRGNYAGSKITAMGNFKSPLGELERNKDDYNKTLRLIGNVSAKVDINNFVFRSLLGIDLYSSRYMDRTLLEPEYTQARSVSSLSQTFNGGFQYNWSNTLNYNLRLNNHSINVLLGTETVNNYSENFNGSRSTFVFEDLDYMVLDAGTSNVTNGGTFNRWALFSVIGRVNYDYLDKYLFEGAVRRDGSSRFIGENRWAVFPAFSIGWRLSQENFLKDIDGLNDLKLRFGWGKNGNDNVGNYNAYSTYRSHGSYSYYNIQGTSINSTEAGFHRNTVGNPNARWEATTTANIGLDAILFKNKLEVNFDVFNRLTSGMLYADSKPGVYGTATLPSVNVGEMKNSGFDLMLLHRNKFNDFSYVLRGNISHYRNEVLKLNDDPDEIRYGTSGTTLREEVYTATQAGQPISSFYGYIVEGIFNTWDEVNSWPKYNPSIDGTDSYSRPGVLKYKDVSKDGVIDSRDRTFIGSPHPDFTYGLNLDLNYKSWNLTMFFQGSYGNDLTNYVNRWTLFNLFEGNRKVERLYESWTAERYESGAKITLPIALRDDATMQKQSSFFVEDGSYFRMKDLQVGYTLPTYLVSKLNLSRVHVYFQATNLFTLSKYSGLDPEVLNMNNLTAGIDVGIYPTSQNLLFGFNIDF